MKYYVYILKCRNGSYYTGFTNKLEKRVSEHDQGLDTKCYTYNRRPIKLVFKEEFQNIYDAIEREKQIKGWSRKKKEALIKGDWDLIVKLSNKK
jgi:putative endonuclease